MPNFFQHDPTFHPGRKWVRFGGITIERTVAAVVSTLAKDMGYSAVMDYAGDMVNTIAHTGQFLFRRADTGAWELRRVDNVLPVDSGEVQKVTVVGLSNRKEMVTPSAHAAFDSVWIQAGFKTRVQFLKLQLQGIAATGVYTQVVRQYKWRLQ